jgi:hypothetical protein
MATQRQSVSALQNLRFDDEHFADVLLHLCSLQGAAWAPLLLHSRALRKSEFFETRLCERWASASFSSEFGQCSKPLEITLDNCIDVGTYVRCIRLLYIADRLKQITFVDVQDALRVLQVAAKLLFHDCVRACMHYLEAILYF